MVILAFGEEVQIEYGNEILFDYKETLVQWRWHTGTE
jgi:hypothetical protein